MWNMSGQFMELVDTLRRSTWLAGKFIKTCGGFSSKPCLTAKGRLMLCADWKMGYDCYLGALFPCYYLKKGVPRKIESLYLVWMFGPATLPENGLAFDKSWEKTLTRSMNLHILIPDDGTSTDIETLRDAAFFHAEMDSCYDWSWLWWTQDQVPRSVFGVS